MVQDLKNVSENDFIADISQIHWDIIYQFDNPNVRWQVWKFLFLETLDKTRASSTQEDIRGNSVPWIIPRTVYEK